MSYLIRRIYLMIRQAADRVTVTPDLQIYFIELYLDAYI